jgi:hypothetical protein
VKPIDPKQLAHVTGGLKPEIPTGERTSGPRNPIPPWVQRPAF